MYIYAKNIRNSVFTNSIHTMYNIFYEILYDVCTNANLIHHNNNYISSYCILW